MPLQLKVPSATVPSDDELARAVLLRLSERRRARTLAARVAQQLMTPVRASRA